MTTDLSKVTAFRRVLETHILVPVFALLLLGVIWLGTYQLIQIEGANVERAAADSSRELVETYEAQIIRNLETIDQALRIIKFAHELQGKQISMAQLREKGLLPPSLIFTISITNHKGDVVTNGSSGKLAYVGDQYYFRRHRDNPTNLSSVSALPLPNRLWKIQFSRRLDNPDGSFAGIAIISGDPSYFTSGYERSRLGDMGVLGLVGPDGIFLAKRTGEKVSWGDAVGPETDRTGVESDTDSNLMRNPWDDIWRYTNVRRIYSFPLSVVVGLSQSEQLATFQQQKRMYLLGASAASFLLVLVAAMLSRQSWQLSNSRKRTRKDQETYYAASSASLDAVFVLRSLHNTQGQIIDFILDNSNDRGARMFGKTKAELLGKKLFVLLPRCHENGMLDEFIQVARTGQVHEEEWENDMPMVQARWLYRQVVRVEDGVVVIVRDISDRKLAEQRIIHMAHHDALTGLPNRTLLEDRVQQAMLYAQRYNRHVMVVFMDLDNFKLINDSLGHKTGDALLKTVADRMVQCVRQTDTVVRLGGDEFVIVLIDQTENSEIITPTLVKIRAAIAEPMHIAGQRLEITSSMGLAMYPGDGDDCDTLLMNADAAMYQAKALGRNNYQFYTAEMNTRIHEKLALQEGLRKAIICNEFSLLYQPQLDLRSGHIFGVEALIRWRHPDKGMISPLDFISLAEETGQIIQIGAWVLRTACRQNKAWQDAGKPPVVVSVNVSARQFRDNNLISQVEQALQESGMDAQYLELELTESLIMQNFDQAISSMQALKKMDVRLSIDDFGTGYSSLSALKSFPIVRLKLDKSFVRDLPANEDDKAIAMAVISLAHKLNLRVLAEGVETDAQLAFLKANDCDEMQGYHFSKPVSAREIAYLFSTHVPPQPGLPAIA